jgi:thioredoxin-like negative regulator of GroEL
MTGVRLLVIAALLFGHSVMCQAQTAEIGADESQIEAYRKAIAGTADNEEKAALYKKIGDLYVSREDYKDAAEEYIHALSLSRGFTEQERIQMAVSISWGDKLDEAISEFRSILKADPKNVEAQIHLARTLSWAGQFDESLDEISKVLEQHPDNRDALLIKANDLRWNGDTDEAFPIYQSLLEEQEDFDARVGYTYVLLARGEDTAARESMALLKPAYPYQEDELKKLQQEISKPKPAPQVQGEANAAVTTPDMKFTNYHDTDGNDVNRFTASYGFTSGKWKNLLSYVHTEATDYTRRGNTNMLSGETWFPVSRLIGMGAGLGIIRYNDNGSADFLLGRLSADREFPWGSVGVTLAEEPLNDTAELIENRIRYTIARADLSSSLTDRLSLSGSFGYADYSDDNNSYNLRLALRRFLTADNPKISIGYRFIYLDFDHQSFDGYFDPNDFVSNQLFAGITFAYGKWSGFVELYGGYQSYRRYGEDFGDIVSGGAADVGYKLTKNISADISVEGGDSAVQTAAGFRYHLIGFKLSGAW